MKIGVVVALLAALAAGTAASGADRPTVARAYVGSASGTLRTDARVDTWKVTGLTFRLQSARFARGRWGGTYLVSGGRVSFTTMLSGSCTGAQSGSFSLGRLSWDAGAVSFLQNLRSAGYAYEARVSKEKPVTVAGCAEVSPAGGLWLLSDIGERLVPGKRLSGSRTERSDRGTRTWSWNLAPR
jgi:hypothetical protein